jgi:serine O-acetyltransferase
MQREEVEHIPDWSRELPNKFWEPDKQLLKAIREYQKLNLNASFLNVILKKMVLLKYRFWSIVTGAEIPLNCQLGGGLCIPHGNGIVIHPFATIGINCLIFHQVTIGTTHKSNGLAPQIGNHVDIGAGAKILGNISIGDNVKIGANVVITKSVESNQSITRSN